jgi:2',3'-cyclic-nucleotide 2'-phosphodiesterase (5'-nucleotidase family)
VAVTTQGAIRQELPPGDISMRTIASIMPFENELVLCSVPGSALSEMMKDPEAMTAGIVRNEQGILVTPDGKPIQPNQVYRVVTTDFLFHGGDGFTFETYDRSPTMTGVNWRDPVVNWTKKAETSPAKPLESVLRTQAH